MIQLIFCVRADGVAEFLHAAVRHGLRRCVSADFCLGGDGDRLGIDGGSSGCARVSTIRCIVDHRVFYGLRQSERYCRSGCNLARCGRSRHRRRCLLLYNADIVQQIHHGAFGIAGHIVAVEPEFELRQIADVLAGKVNLYGCPCALGRIGKGAAHIDDAAAV